MSITRRGFLKGSAAAAAGAALGVRVIAPEPEPQPEQVTTRQFKGEIALGTADGRLVGRREILLEESTGNGYKMLRPVTEPVVFEQAGYDWGTVTHVVLFGHVHPLHMGVERERLVRKLDTARISGVWARTLLED